LTAYRFFLLDRSNRFRGAEIIEAPDDASARARAETMQAELGAAGFELWQGARPVLQRRTQVAA
jgi:hypothetical protein